MFSVRPGAIFAQSKALQRSPLWSLADWCRSLIAIHGIYEDAKETWRDPTSSLVWLRDLLDYDQLGLRVMLYSYQVKFHDAHSGSADRVLPYAQTLLQTIFSNRDDTDAVRRPLIFVCHGAGGIILKKALLLSHSIASGRTQHLKSIYLSTSTILYFSTPHAGVEPSTHDKISRRQRWKESSSFIKSLEVKSEMIESLMTDFQVLDDLFDSFHFWENLPTKFGSDSLYVVEQVSAAPQWQLTERSGIDADHSSMVKFKSKKDQGFSIVLRAISKAVSNRRQVITRRWDEEDSQRLSSRQHVALLSPSSSQERRCSLSNMRSRSPLLHNRHYHVQRSSSTIFTGQVQILETMRKALIDDKAHGDGPHHNVLVLHGLGGSGKTEVCLRFLETTRKEFWGIFWINAKSIGDADSGFAEIGRQAGRAAGAKHGLHWLSEQTEPWLLILDNADDTSIDVSQYFPAGGWGNIIITTQNPGNTVHETVGTIRLSGMDPEDAVTLLLKAARENDPGKSDVQKHFIARRLTARPIVDALGYLALAIIGAAATIRKKIASLEDFLPWFSQSKASLRVRHSTASAEGQEDYLTIIAAWEMPLGRIIRHRTLQHLDAIHILSMLSCLHFDRVPTELFTRARNIFQQRQITGVTDWMRLGQAISEYVSGRPNLPDIVAGSLRFSSQGFAIRLQKALSILQEHSLIEYDSKTQHCSLHPLVHRWALDRQSDVMQKYWLETTTLVIDASINAEFEASGYVYRCKMAMHIRACLALWKMQYRQITNEDRYAPCALKFSRILHESGAWKEAADLQQAITAFFATRYGMEDEKTMLAIDALGRTYWDLGEVTLSKNARERLYQCRLHAYGQNDIRTLQAQDNLCHVYWLSGDRSKSLQFGQAAVAGLRTALGTWDPLTLNATHNLARTLLHVNQSTKALKLITAVKNKRMHFFGSRHADTVASLQELSMIYLVMGRFDEAERICRDVLRVRVATLGEEAPYTLWIKNDLAKVLCAKGQTTLALTILQRVDEIAVRTLGTEHVGTSMTRANLATAYVQLGQWKDAEEMLEALVKVLDKDHADWEAAVAKLATVVRRRKEQSVSISAEAQITDAKMQK